MGTLRGATFLPEGSASAFCRFRLVAGPGWALLDGAASGQTQTACVSSGAGFVASIEGEAFRADGTPGCAAAAWEHPLDARFACATLTGWPQVAVTVWRQDAHARHDLIGYGTARVPAAPGAHVLEVATWRPVGSFAQELALDFLGSGAPQLTDATMVCDPVAGGRHAIATVTSALVEVHLEVLAKDFGMHGVALAPA